MPAITTVSLLQVLACCHCNVLMILMQNGIRWFRRKRKEGERRAVHVDCCVISYFHLSTLLSKVCRVFIPHLPTVKIRYAESCAAFTYAIKPVTSLRQIVKKVAKPLTALGKVLYCRFVRGERRLSTLIVVSRWLFCLFLFPSNFFFLPLPGTFFTQRKRLQFLQKSLNILVFSKSENSPNANARSSFKNR